MLTGLTLRNFKCFELADIPLGRITVLIGENGTGKSSVLHALALLRQSNQSAELNYNGPLVDLSGYDDVVFEKDASRGIEISYSAEGIINGVTLLYTYDVLARRQLERLRFTYQYTGNSHEIIWGIDGESPMNMSFGNLEFELGTGPTIGAHAGIRSYSGGQDLVGVHKTLSDILRSPSQDMSIWRYSPITRRFTRSYYQLNQEIIGEIREDMDMHTSSSGLASTLEIDEDVLEEISSWLSQITDVQIDSRVMTNHRVAVRSRSTVAKSSVPIVNEGFGTNQLIFMLFQLAKTPRGGLDMIEEPELNLHPRAIAKLADLLCAESLKSVKQLMLTTHSEHLLLGLLNNVAEGKLAASDLVVLYTSLTEDGAKVERVNINDEGMAEGGLPGFFDATLEAQRRHLEALSRR